MSRRTTPEEAAIQSDENRVPPAMLQQLPPKSRQALDDWYSAFYIELKRLASAVKRSDIHAGISTSTLVHEAWIKLAKASRLAPQSQLHFKRIAACVMRQIVMDEARKRNAGKRVGDGVVCFVTLDDFVDVAVSSSADLLRLDTALNSLAKVNLRQAELIQLRFFGGYDVAETSKLLNISESTALLDWRVAKAWLAAEIRKGS
jgi:RNA polymerase sigma factor (TIGR02999 family)